MKASVLLISYNQEQYIQKAVESILMQQTLFDFEIIVADDFSTDSTANIIVDMLNASDHSYRVLTYNANVGRRKNYERGFAACAGEYIAILEGDDYWTDSNRLQKHVAFLDSNPDCLMSFNRYLGYNNTKNVFALQQGDYSSQYEFITTTMLIKKNYIHNLSTCVVRKSGMHLLKKDLHKIGFADWMLGMALSEHGKIVKIAEPMSVYRKHDKGLWSGNTEVTNLQRLVDKTIPKYDQYFDYKYHDEFQAKSTRLKAKIKRLNRRNALISKTPDFLVGFAKRLLPKSWKTALLNRF